MHETFYNLKAFYFRTNIFSLTTFLVLENSVFLFELKTMKHIENQLRNNGVRLFHKYDLNGCFIFQPTTHLRI